MTFKKVMSALLAGAMVLTMGMTAMASSDETSKSDLEQVAIDVGSTVNVPTLKIMMPNSVGMVVNPYKLQANVGTEQNPILKNGQIVSKTYFIKNYSPMGIKVTPTISGGASFTLLPSGSPSASPDSDGFLEKQGIVNFEFMQANNGDEPTWADPVPATNKMVLGEEEAKPSPSAIPVLSIGTEPTTEVPNPINFDNSLAFRFTGFVTGSPSEPWTTEDSVNASLVFDFSSQPNENGTLTSTKTELDLQETNAANKIATITMPTGAPAAKIVYKSSDTAKATVVAKADGSAEVTPVDNGTATISAIYQTANDKKVHIDTIDIEVVSKYAATITETAGSGSAVSASGATVTSGGKIKAGDLVTVTPGTPTTAGHVATVTVSGASGSVDVTNNTFTMPAEAVTITIAFAAPSP